MWSNCDWKFNQYTNVDGMHSLKEQRNLDNKMGLTETEYELMEFFWVQSDKVCFRDVLTYFNSVKEKNWKKQTLSTFLTILQRDGHLKADKKGRKYLYYAACEKSEYSTKWVRQLCEELFDNSIRKFLLAFSGNQKLSAKEVDELERYIEEYKNDTE